MIPFWENLKNSISDSCQVYVYSTTKNQDWISLAISTVDAPRYQY
jgi:hypothetical protein